MRQKVFRPWIQTSVLVACFATFVLIAVVSLTIGDELIRTDPASIAIYVVIAVSCLYGLWRALRFGVRVGADGLRLRSLGRDQLVSWSAITGVTAGKSGEKFLVSIYAPFIELADQPGPVPVTAMSSYSPAKADRRAALLREYVASAQTTSA